MKVLKYNLCTIFNDGTEENPTFIEVLTPVEMGWNETNEGIAKIEAHKGEYIIEDDGMEESAETTQEERIEELEEALAMILDGVTE